MSESFGTYDFGLSDEREDLARTLHAESLIIDTLWQGPMSWRGFTREMEERTREHWESTRDLTTTLGRCLYLPHELALAGELPAFERTWRQTGVTGGNRQVSFGRHALTTWGGAQSQFDGFPWMVKAVRADDFVRAKRDGLIAGYLNSQLSTGSPTTLDEIAAAHQLGMRMMQLTYNTMNEIGAGCTERTDAGVSRFGASVIATMNDLGMIVDTAHSGRQTTLDACRLSTKPVVASHTCAAALFEHARNKDDEQIRAIADTGGTVGVAAVPFFLGTGDVTIEAMLDHVDHVAELVGIDHVTIGTDWPMQMPKWSLHEIFDPFAAEVGFRQEHRVDGEHTLVGFSDYRDWPNITRGLVARGYDEDDIRKVLGGNFLRVFRECCG